MCTVSMIGDEFNRRWKWVDPYLHPQTIPWPSPSTNPAVPNPYNDIFKDKPGPTQQEFDDLKKEVEIMKELLKAAKKYDEENGEPDCEIDAKMEFLRKAAALVGISLDDVLKPKQ